MAPGKNTKQSLLCISDFLKQPSKAVLKKHKKLERNLLPYITGKARVDPKKKELAKREKEVRKGSQEWRNFLVASGIENVDKFDTELLFLANGSKPPIPTLEENDDVGVPDSDDEDDDIIAIDTIDDV